MLETGERLQEKTLFLCWGAEILVSNIIPSSSQVSVNLLTDYGLQPDELKKKPDKEKKTLHSLGTFKSNSITLHEQHTYLYLILFSFNVFFVQEYY